MSIGETYLTMTGHVGGDVLSKQMNSGVALASFRLASTPRVYDRSRNTWVDRPTTWLTVECWRGLAQNVVDSVQRGQPVIVTGRLKTSEWKDEESGELRSRLVLDAISVGHDLSRGTAVFSKNPPQAFPAGPSLDEEMRDLSNQAEATQPPDPEESVPLRPVA